MSGKHGRFKFMTQNNSTLNRASIILSSSPLSAFFNNFILFIHSKLTFLCHYHFASCYLLAKFKCNCKAKSSMLMMMMSTFVCAFFHLSLPFSASISKEKKRLLTFWLNLYERARLSFSLYYEWVQKCGFGVIFSLSCSPRRAHWHSIANINWQRNISFSLLHHVFV
jgi:hypothetical protein